MEFKFVEQALKGKIICNIGQISDAEERQFNKLVKQGALLKWRGHWVPVTGASWGIGPLKTCWALPATVKRHG